MLCHTKTNCTAASDLYSICGLYMNLKPIQNHTESFGCMFMNKWRLVTKLVWNKTIAECPLCQLVVAEIWWLFIPKCSSYHIFFFHEHVPEIFSVVPTCYCHIVRVCKVSHLESCLSVSICTALFLSKIQPKIALCGSAVSFVEAINTSSFYHHSKLM